MKPEKKIPTILGIILLLLSLFAGAYLTSMRTSLSSKASADCKPQNIQITNLTHNSFDLSFLTDSSCASLLQIDNRSLSAINQSDSEQKSKIHYFQVTSLKEKTNYRYSLISGGTDYNLDSYQVETAQTPTGPIPSSNLAWGKVLNPDLTPAKDAIVYLAIPGAFPLSAPVSENGYWNISLAISFNEQKTAYFSSPPNLEEDIIVISSDSTTTQITSNSSQNNPVPDIIIGQNSFSSAPLGQEAGSIGQVTSAPASKKLDIQNPSKDNDTLNTQQPQFFGTAPQNSKIIIEVHSSQVINSETNSTSDGSWTWSPPQDLEPGQHTITVKTQDPLTGLWQTVTRSFVVLAADSDLSFTASNSATLSSPTPSPSPFPTAVTSPSPTTTLAPTLKPSLAPTLKPTATPSTLPQSGNPLITFSLLLFALPFILTSLHLFTKSDKFN